MLLIDRKKELEFLEGAFNSKKSEFIIIYGRRRLGKTYLTKYFAEDKLHFYFLSRQRAIEKEFLDFKDKLSKKFNVFLESKNFEELFKEINSKISKGKRFLIIIDEFPYWIINNKGIVSEFQYYWDEILSNENVILLVLGSYMSMMENILLSYKSPVYGRKTGQIELLQMPLSSLREFFPKKNIAEVIKIYGFADTIPYYLLMVGNENNLKEIFKNLLSPYLNFYNDAELLIKEELREYNVYLDILKAINDGATKLSEISNKSRVDITNILKYLKILRGMKIIEKIKPVTAGTKEKNYLYVIKDNYFKFWLKFIYPHYSEIAENLEEHASFIEKEYNSYMGGIFEEFCRRFLMESGIFSFSKIGKWWHNDCELDVVLINEKDNEIFLGECKWKDNINSGEMAAVLYKKSKNVIWKNENRGESFIVFAKSFSKRIKEFEGKKVYCFDLKDIEKILKHK